MRAAVPLYLDSLQHVLRCQTDTLARMYGLDTPPAGMGSLGAFVRSVTSHLWAMQLLRLGALEPHVVGYADCGMRMHHTARHRDAVQAFCSRQQAVLRSSVFGSTRQRPTPATPEQQATRASMDRIENAEAVLRVRCIHTLTCTMMCVLHSSTWHHVVAFALRRVSLLQVTPQAIVDGSELLITLIAALHFSRTAVTAHDVLRAAAQGTLPYLDAWPLVQPTTHGKQGGELLQYAMRNACTCSVLLM